MAYPYISCGRGLSSPVLSIHPESDVILFKALPVSYVPEGIEDAINLTVGVVHRGDDKGWDEILVKIFSLYKVRKSKTRGRNKNRSVR